jgi:hypothetical protein
MVDNGCGFSVNVLVTRRGEVRKEKARLEKL